MQDLTKMSDEELVDDLIDMAMEVERRGSKQANYQRERAEILRRLSLVREYGRYKCQPMESPSWEGAD